VSRSQHRLDREVEVPGDLVAERRNESEPPPLISRRQHAWRDRLRRRAACSPPAEEAPAPSPAAALARYSAASACCSSASAVVASPGPKAAIPGVSPVPKWAGAGASCLVMAHEIPGVAGSHSAFPCLYRSGRESEPTPTDGDRLW
jgi:hypothetical protein